MAPRGEDSVSTQLSNATAASTEPIISSLHQDGNPSTNDHSNTAPNAIDRNGPLASFQSLELEDQKCHYQTQPQPQPQSQTKPRKALRFPLETLQRPSSMQQPNPQSDSQPLKSIMTCRSSSSCSLSSTTCTTTDSKSTKSSKQERKTVSFQSLEIRTFHRVLGDHPCCNTGLPITFGWNPVEESKIHLEEYETSRSPRRSRHALRMNDEVRRNMLTQDENESNDESDENSSSSNEELLSKMDLKRAERRLYRNRQRVKRRVIASKFFDCPRE